MQKALPQCLVISDGRRGIENQALGLAEAICLQTDFRLKIHKIGSDAWFAGLPPRLQFALRGQTEKYGLISPFPEIAIGCGRQAIAPLQALKKSAGEKIFTVYAQAPRLKPDNFDLVIAPRHDGLAADSVFNIIGAPNRITPKRLASAKSQFSAELKKLKAPRAVFLIGGTSGKHQLADADHRTHMDAIGQAQSAGYSVLISTSRRTPDWAIQSYRQLANEAEAMWFYHPDDPGPNPYFAFLASADLLFVTEDSTNMLTEAASTGTPLIRLPMSGKPGKFSSLYNDLAEKYRAEVWTDFNAAQLMKRQDPLDETRQAAQALLKQFHARRE